MNTETQIQNIIHQQLVSVVEHCFLESTHNIFLIQLKLSNFVSNLLSLSCLPDTLISNFVHRGHTQFSN